MPRALRPFRRPPYRLLATALALSLLGVGIWAVALVFQVRKPGLHGSLEVAAECKLRIGVEDVVERLRHVLP